MNLLDRFRADPSPDACLKWIASMKSTGGVPDVHLEIRQAYWPGYGRMFVSDIVLKGGGKVFWIQGYRAHAVWRTWIGYLRSGGGLPF